MHFEFEHLGTATPFELAEGQHLLGGGPEDQVRLEGLPAGFLTLRIEGPRLTVEATEGYRVNGVLVPPGVPRLVLPGEVLGLPEDMRLKVLQPPLEGERGAGTLAVLKNLLADGDDLATSRAATLTCLTGLDVGRTFALAEEMTDIGRGTHVDLRVRDRTVSRSHARIVHEDSTFTLLDLDSPNGVYVNGQRVQGAMPLVGGDVIELGKTLLRFQAPLEEPAPTSEPAAPRPPLAPDPASQASSEAPPRKPRGAWWFVALGVAMALAGVLVTYALLT